MGSVERSKKNKVHLCKKAVVHFLLCFVMGFFTGFAPTTTKSSILSTLIFSTNRSSAFSISPQPTEVPHHARTQSGSFNRSLLNEEEEEEEAPHEGEPERSAKSLEVAEEEKEEEEGEEEELLIPRRLIIVVTPTRRMKDRLSGVHLRRLSNTLRLVPPPLLWVVVEQQTVDSSREEVPGILRKTGIMYRHLVFKENFTDAEAEMDHQRNLALNHIEHHRLSGIVHFAGLSNFYDLSFFDEIRAIEVFGTWPMALLSANRKRVAFDGPVCDSSEVVGWHLRKMNNLTETRSSVHISRFAFNSSILWDPERWGRSSSVQDNSQNTIKFVKKEVLEEETKLIGIPSEGCSKIMLWNLHIPTTTNNHLPVTHPAESS